MQMVLFRNDTSFVSISSQHQTLVQQGLAGNWPPCSAFRAHADHLTRKSLQSLWYSGRNQFCNHILGYSIEIKWLMTCKYLLILMVSSIRKTKLDHEKQKRPAVGWIQQLQDFCKLLTFQPSSVASLDVHMNCSIHGSWEKRNTGTVLSRDAWVEMCKRSKSYLPCAFPSWLPDWFFHCESSHHNI